MAQAVKNLPAMRETWVWFLGWEDPLEKGMATHPSVLAWRIPWTEEPGRLMGSKRVRHALATKEREREKHSAFIVGFISVIITSTPRQTSRH